MALTRQEKEKLVLDLYYSQNKSYHQIAKEARICPRDIKAVLDKPVKAMELKQSISLSSQAYKLFSEGKTPLQVAIALNLRDAQVTEYWNLNNLHGLSQIHEEIKDDISLFVRLYRLAKAAGMNTQHVVNVLKIVNNHLPSVEQRYEELKREEASLQAGNHNSARTFQELSDQISDLRNTPDSYRSSCEKARRQMAELHQKKDTVFFCPHRSTSFLNSDLPFVPITIKSIFSFSATIPHDYSSSRLTAPKAFIMVDSNI